MAYKVKEIFYTLQGEGVNSGRPAVFCRFSGCNLWNGKEADRSNAICKFCDTDFIGTDGLGGGSFSDAKDLAKTIISYWPVQFDSSVIPLIVFTGGEPLLQLDSNLTELCHLQGFEIAIETNGTLLPPSGIDWICVSPKSATEVILRSGQELKIVYPQDGVDPVSFENFDFQYFFLQPMDGLHFKANAKLAVEYCLKNPKWRLSLQTHKMLGIR